MGGSRTCGYRDPVHIAYEIESFYVHFKEDSPSCAMAQSGRTIIVLTFVTSLYGSITECRIRYTGRFNKYTTYNFSSAKPLPETEKWHYLCKQKFKSHSYHLVCQYWPQGGVVSVEEVVVVLFSEHAGERIDLSIVGVSPFPLLLQHYCIQLQGRYLQYLVLHLVGVCNTLLVITREVHGWMLPDGGGLSGGGGGGGGGGIGGGDGALGCIAVGAGCSS